MLLNNTRGYKSKEAIVQRIIHEENPVLVALVETKLEKSDNIDIPGYKVVRGDRESKGGGVLVAYKKCLEHIAVCTSEYKKHDCEMMWHRIDNGKVKAKVGVIYMPQESRTTVEILKEIYAEIEQEIIEAVKNGDSLIILGDLNCKVGCVIPGNKDEVTTGGRLLIKLMKKHRLRIVNAEQCCEGLWTRIEGEQKSVIDYILVLEDDIDLVHNMFIDEDKDITPYHIESINGHTETVYTDHCTITMTMNLTIQNDAQPTYCKVLDKDGLAKFKGKLTDEKVSEILDEKRNIKETYSRWNKRVLQIRDSCMRKVKIRKKWKVARKLCVARKKLSRELRITTNKERIKIIKIRRKVLKEQIDEEEHKKRFIRIERIVADIKKNGGVNSNTFWTVRAKLTGKKKEAAHAIIDEEGKRKDNPEEIRQVYSRWYQNLLFTQNAETDAGKQAEEVIQLVSQSMEVIAATPRITSLEEVDNVVKNLNPKKARDSDTWKNNLIIEGGEEMNKSLQMIINQVDNQKVVPDEWERMEIMTTHKKGERMFMNNKRGLFLTNNVSKVYERVVKSRNDETFRSGLTEWQNGGITERGPIDNTFLINSIIERNNYYKKSTYLVLTDAEKCFDKLWLDDGIFELWRCGTDIRDCMMIKNLNKKAEVIVRTPVGDTEPFTLHNIVRQGTVYGPQICAASMDKINIIGKDIVTYYSPELPIRAGVFVDDVNGAGEVTVANNVIYNCGLLEDRKKMTFSVKNGKTEYMVIGPKKVGIESLTNEVKSGRVERVIEHKTLGMWLDESGDYGINIIKKKEKLPYMIHTTRREANPQNIGVFAVEARLQLAEVVVIPSILYSSEAFSTYKQKEIDQLEQIQHTILTGILEMPSTTPYYPLIMETGWWTMKSRVAYRKLMLYHNIVKSDERRVIKKSLEIQKKEDRPTTWYSSIQDEMNEYDIKLDVGNSSKSQWKNHVKKKITTKDEKVVRRKCFEMSKGRTIRSNAYGKKEYLGKVSLGMTRKILKYRTHMIVIPGNYKARTEGECLMCRVNKGTTEHYFVCPETKYLADVWEVDAQDLQSNEIEKMKKVANFMEKVELLMDPLYKNR